MPTWKDILSALAGPVVTLLLFLAGLWLTQRGKTKTESSEEKRARIEAENDPQTVAQVFLRMDKMEERFDREIAANRVYYEAQIAAERHARETQEERCREEIAGLQATTKHQEGRITELEATLDEMEGTNKFLNAQVASYREKYGAA